jgi:hypothetical protein
LEEDIVQPNDQSQEMVSSWIKQNNGSK